MDPQPKREMLQPQGRLTWSILAASAVVAVTVVTGWLAIRYVESEWQRDLRNWQVRLGIVSDSFVGERQVRHPDSIQAYKRRC